MLAKAPAIQMVFSMIVKGPTAKGAKAAKEPSIVGATDLQAFSLAIYPLRRRFLLTDVRPSLIIRKARPRSGFGGETRKGQQPCGLWPTVWVPASAASGGLKHWEKLSFRACKSCHRHQSVGKKCALGSPESPSSRVIPPQKAKTGLSGDPGDRRNREASS